MSQSLRTRRTLLPGQPGTKKLVQEYGDALLCVRYRYDATKKERVKTVEVIIERDPWEPDPTKIPAHKRLSVRVELGEKSLGKRVRAAGGRWNRQKKVWEVPYKTVVELDLLDRVVEESDL